MPIEFKDVVGAVSMDGGVESMSGLVWYLRLMGRVGVSGSRRRVVVVPSVSMGVCGVLGGGYMCILCRRSMV